MQTKNISQKTSLAIFISLIGSPAFVYAAPFKLAQYPAGTAYKAPIPNVILSIDTSGSMSYCDVNDKQIGSSTWNSQTENCYQPDKSIDERRITYVKKGLKSLLIDSNKYDGQFRLAWQSFACNSIPSRGGNCDNKNSMAKFTSTHKENFGTWVNQITATGTTPSPVLVWSAGNYLQKTGAESPWNAKPGTADNAPLACRRSYHIFLTDGGWNFEYNGSNVSNEFRSAMNVPSSDASSNLFHNADGKNRQLPDNKSYSITDAQTQIYRDTYGTGYKSTGTGSSRKYYAYPTLADMAFYFWATDLQPSISNELIPKIRKSGTESFTSGNKSVTFDEYWNPKNNPAKWQNLVHYTIGYGIKASKLSNNTTTSPQWSGGMFGMYSSGFTDLAVGNKKWDNVTSSSADNDYDDYRPQEMWHMAINSRGKFYPVSGGDLSGVFADIFDDIVVDNAPPISGFTSASGSVSRVGTQSYQTSYIATEDASSLDDRWYGYITSDFISTSGNFSPNRDWGLNANNKHITTADKLDQITNLDNRLILTFDKYADIQKAVSFKWSNLSGSTTGLSPKMWLNKGSIGNSTTIQGDGKGENRLKFIRGDRTKEARVGGEFRNRKSRQGDIVNSAIWYTGAPTNGYTEVSYKNFAKTYRGRLPMLYVGGNDGMLHGFSAKDGTEKIAYIPHGVIHNLAKLSDTDYTHRYFVDGSPFSGDINLGSNEEPNWRTYLAGTLGAGGRGYFVLDVTQPGKDPSFVESPVTPAAPDSNFQEANASNLVVMDRTAAEIGTHEDPNAHPDIGHIFGNPVVAESNQQRALQITRTNNQGRWALIIGNGYNSTNERPVLLIQYLDGNKSLQTIPAVEIDSEEANGNGLSTPQFLDVNGDSIPDFVYAGDLRGNLWKFDISSSSASDWGVAFDGKPLFTATYSSATGSSSRQPITAPPVLRPNPTVGGLMVAFGTGQNLTETDRDDTSVQTIYSILDNTRYEIESAGDNKGKVKIKASAPSPTIVSGRSDLQAEYIADGAGTGTAGSNASNGRSFWKLSSTEVTYACASNSTNCTEKKGWYMDLPVAGERITTGFDFYDGSNILEIISEKPASGSATASGEEVCAPQPQAAKPFRTLINIVSGAPASVPIMDVNGDGFYNAVDNGYARMTASSKELRIGTKDLQIRKGNDGSEDRLAKLPELVLRPNWRQLK